MRLVELFEKQYYAPPAEEIANKIKKDCQSFLQSSGGVPLYRGTKETNLDFFVGDIPTNRLPVDMAENIHNNLNYAFKKLGFAATRANSIFCTGNEIQALFYGPAEEKVYIVFPIGDFSFAWSPTISDLHGIKQDLKNMDQEEIVDFVENNYVNNVNLERAIVSGNEIMITGKHYYAVDDEFYFDEVKRLVFEK